MNTSSDNLAKMAETSHRRVDDVIRSGQDAAHRAVDRVADGAGRWAENADQLAHRSADVLRERGEHLRERARHLADGTVVQIQQQPLRAVLLAGAIGAVFGLLLAMTGRSRY